MFAREAVIGHPTKDVHPEPAEGLFSDSPFLAGQCKIISIHTAHLPVPKSLAAKSRVSITSKLIQTKRLQAGLYTSRKEVVYSPRTGQNENPSYTEKLHV